MTYSVHLKTAK